MQSELRSERGRGGSPSGGAARWRGHGGAALAFPSGTTNARRSGGPEDGFARRARQIRRRPRWRTPAARFGLWGMRRRSPWSRAACGVVLACAPPFPPSLRSLSLSLVSSGRRRARPCGERPAAARTQGVWRWPARGARGGGRRMVAGGRWGGLRVDFRKI